MSILSVEEALELVLALAPAPHEPTVRQRTWGRGTELAAINRAAAEASGGLRVVWIGGEAGAGKTTLVDAAAARQRVDPSRSTRTAARSSAGRSRPTPPATTPPPPCAKNSSTAG